MAREMELDFPNPVETRAVVIRALLEVVPRARAR